MAEIIWSGTRMFTSLSGDKEVARSHKRDARILIGYLLGTTSDLRPYAYRTVRLADGSIVQAHVWRGDGVTRAKVRIWSPTKEKEEESEILGFVLFLASNDALYGFGATDPITGEHAALGSSNTTTSPIWVWSRTNKLYRFDQVGFAWNVDNLAPTQQDPHIVSLGRAMFYNPTLGNIGDLRLNEDAIVTAFPVVYGFCIREIDIDNSPQKVVIVAGQQSAASNDTLLLRFFSFSSYAALGEASIIGLTAWGENQDTACARYVAFSKSGSKIAILVTLLPEGANFFSSALAEAAVFEADILDVRPDAEITAVLRKEPSYDIISQNIETQQSGLIGREDEQVVIYFAAAGTYESPFMVYWNDEEKLKIWTAGVKRDYTCGYTFDGYEIPPQVFTNTSWSSYLAGAYAANTGSTCNDSTPGFWAGFETAQSAGWYVKNEASDKIQIYLKLNEEQKHTHTLYEYINLVEGDNSGNTGVPGWPDVIAGEADGCIGTNPAGDPFSFFAAVSDYCTNLYPIPVELAYFGINCGYQTPPPGLHLFGRGEIDQFLISPLLFMQKDKVSFIRGGSVTELYYDSYLSPSLIPQPGTVTNYDYDDRMFLQTGAVSFQIGERAAPKRGITRITTIAQFMLSLLTTLKSRFLDEPQEVAGLAKSFGKVRTNRGDRELAIITANNAPHSLVREDQLIEFAGGGVLRHSIFGKPPTFPENTQACFNLAAPDYYTGTIASLNI